MAETRAESWACRTLMDSRKAGCSVGTKELTMDGPTHLAIHSAVMLANQIPRGGKRAVEDRGYQVGNIGQK